MKAGRSILDQWLLTPLFILAAIILLLSANIFYEIVRLFSGDNHKAEYKNKDHQYTERQREINAYKGLDFESEERAASVGLEKLPNRITQGGERPINKRLH